MEQNAENDWGKYTEKLNRIKFEDNTKLKLYPQPIYVLIFHIFLKQIHEINNPK